MSNDIEDRSSSVTDIRIEVTDDELKELSNYFLKSKDEIQKKVDSLLALEIPMISPRLAKQEVSPTPKTVKKENLNGTPIDLNTATILRELTVGSCVHSFSNDWRRAKLVFREENNELSYGLLSEKNGSKGFILSVQTVVLRNLIEKNSSDTNGESKNNKRTLRPTNRERIEKLIKSIADILWRAGEKTHACVALNSLSNCFDTTSSSSNLRSNYFPDGLTEKLHLYEFKDYKLLENFVRNNLITFQKEDGCITLLYSIILSRKIDSLLKDLQGQSLLGQMEDCKIALYTLILTGTATPYLHNGNTYYDTEGQSLDKPLIGIKNRSEIGLLYWDSKENDDSRTEVGSMLKTPRYPIWLLLMGKNMIAIMFHTNMELINNWRFEITFTLNYYTALKKQVEPYEIDIETRDNTNELQVNPDFKLKYGHLFKFFDEDKELEIISIIKTKWPDCEIPNTDGKDLMGCL